MTSHEDNDEDLADERVTTNRRANQQTDRLPSREVPRTEPIRSDWLSSRQSGRSTKGRRNKSVPSSRDEFVLWLQHGGWRPAALIIAGTFAVVVLMIMFFNRSALVTSDTITPTADIGVGGNTGIGVFPTLDPLQQVTAAPATPLPATNSDFQVSGTEAEGLLLRSDPSRDPNNPLANVIATLPEGSTVTVIGEDVVGPDRVWKNIRAADGQQGWAASDFLQQVQP